MFNLDAITNENNKYGNIKWPYRILIIVPSGSGKTNAFLNLIQQDNGNLNQKIYLYAKDLSEPKYQFLIKKREDAGIKNLDDPSAFIEYSNTTDDLMMFTIILMIITQKEKKRPCLFSMI